MSTTPNRNKTPTNLEKFDDDDIMQAAAVLIILSKINGSINIGYEQTSREEKYMEG